MPALNIIAIQLTVRNCGFRMAWMRALSASSSIEYGSAVSARAPSSDIASISRCSQSADQSGAISAPWPQIEPSCWPPALCQTWRPRSMSARV